MPTAAETDEAAESIVDAGPLADEIPAPHEAHAAGAHRMPDVADATDTTRVAGVGAPQPYAPPPAIRLEDAVPAGQTAIWPSAIPAAQPPPVPAPAASAPVASPVELSSSAAARERRRRPQLRTSVTILLFLAGVAVGVVGLRLAQVQPAPVAVDGFPTLERTAGEPIQAGAVAHELAINHVEGLAQLLDSDTLSALQTQLRPLVSFESVTFVGATSFDHDTYAGYIVRGRDSDGTLGLVGLVIRLRDGQVVAQ